MDASGPVSTITAAMHLMPRIAGQTAPQHAIGRHQPGNGARPHSDSGSPQATTKRPASAAHAPGLHRRRPAPVRPLWATAHTTETGLPPAPLVCNHCAACVDQVLDCSASAWAQATAQAAAGSSAAHTLAFAAPTAGVAVRAAVFASQLQLMIREVTAVQVRVALALAGLRSTGLLAVRVAVTA